MFDGMPSTVQLQCGIFRLDLARQQLLDAAGSPIRLRPKSFDLLHVLVLRAGCVVPRGELLDLVWGAVHVTDDSVTQGVTQIRRALGGRAGVQLRTMSRRGYMLELAQPSGPPEAYPPRVAVSPFVGLGGEAAAAIGQSIANELRVELVNQRSFEVVASARAPSDYRLEGSVRVEAARLRVTAQLVSMRSATLSWAERYDVPIARSTSLATQDEVVKRIVQDVHRAVAG